MTNQISAELAAILAVADDGSHTEIDVQGTRIWRNDNGLWHRDGDLPALIYAEGDIFYYKDGNLYRDGDLLAVIYSDGSEFYYRDGKRHRDGGKPAVIYADGTVEYWVDGVKQIEDN